MARFKILTQAGWRYFDSIVDARAYAIKILSGIKDVRDKYGNFVDILIFSGGKVIGEVTAFGPKERRSYWYMPTRNLNILRTPTELYKNGKLIGKK